MSNSSKAITLQPPLQSPTDDIAGTLELHFSIVGAISNLIFMACMIWQIMTYFFSLREASDLEVKSLWYGFIIAILLGDVIWMTGSL